MDRYLVCLSSNADSGSIHSRLCSKISHLRPECSRMRTWLDSKSSLKKEVGRRSSMITRRRGIPRPSNPEVRCSSTNKEALRKNAYHGAENQKRTHFIHSNQSRTCHFWHQDFPCDQDIENLYEADMTSNLNANENDPHSFPPSPPLPPPRLRQG